eukprot:TRINITY_DN8400_c0_g1_i9.p1 TRINITY_DN8400_c0_g1~~TRINITY_DN8400_c0_g1_i9.p1  ORF type:complete len:215 (+),score=21.14 TRINITY_DN8400_c0_g1_i9:93-737(+)
MGRGKNCANFSTNALKRVWQESCHHLRPRKSSSRNSDRAGEIEGRLYSDGEGNGKTATNSRPEIASRSHQTSPKPLATISSLTFARAGHSRAAFFQVKSAQTMTYVVTDNCIRCKYMDCVEVCPVDCFYEGENMLVINPNECIDCGVCEPECPAEAILPDTENGLEKWLELNTKYSAEWPNITVKGEAPADADAMSGVENKLEQFFSPEPGEGS